MNKLFWNYPAKILSVIDLRSFEMEIDYGRRRCERTRGQLIETKWDTSSWGVGQKDDAKKCLESALIDETGEGRQVIVATVSPDAYNQCYYRVYVQCRSDNMVLPQAIMTQIAGVSLISVNLFMLHMMEMRFNVEYAKNHFGGYEPLTTLTINQPRRKLRTSHAAP